MKKSVTLTPDESKIVTFTYTPTEPKSYLVDVDGLRGSFIAHEVPAARFEVSELVIEPSEVYVNQSVSISVVVTNVGGRSGSYEVICEVI